MKKLAIICAVFVVTALVSVSVTAQTKTEEKKESALLATWSISIAAPGQELPGTFKLEKDGDNYKGSVTTDLSGESLLKNIKINDDNSFTADITVNVQGQNIEGTMTGKLADDKLSGELNLAGFGAIPYSGKKG